MDGVLIINKAAGMTSHDVVARVRRILNERSVGHLGTLDPSATGVLPLVVGRFTRLAQFYNDADKRYEGVIRFGFATDTYDAEGEPLGPAQPVSLTVEQVRQAAARFTGKLEQVPPLFSAKKIAGVPAYKLARKKQDVELRPKPVEITEFNIVDWDGRQARFTAWVSSGTYIRSLAHNLGQALGTGAHLAELTRTAVREFRLDEAHSLEQLEAAWGGTKTGISHPSPGPPKTTGASPPSSMSDNEYYVNNEQARSNSASSELFLHPRMVLPEFPAICAPPEALVKIRHGAAVNLPEFSKAGLIRVFEGQASLLCIARRVAGTLFQPKVVLI